MNVQQLSEPTLQKVASGATYTVSGGLITVDVLQFMDVINAIDNHPGFAGFCLGALTLLMNWYYNHKNSKKNEDRTMRTYLEPAGGKAGWILALVLAVCLVFIQGCSVVEERFEDGYQFGDISGAALDVTQHMLEQQEAYCSGADPGARALLLTFARALEPEFPEDGICTDMFTYLATRDDSSQ